MDQPGYHGKQTMLPRIANQKSAEGLKVFLALQERILHGEYLPGVWLPTERELAEEFTVNRTVVRGALLRLEQEGLIAREAGRRPWVSAPSQRSPRSANAQNTIQGLCAIIAILPQHPAYHASAPLIHGMNMKIRSEEAPFRLMVFDTYGETIDATIEFERNALQAVRS